MGLAILDDRWSRRRRVIGKAEWTEGEVTARFIVTRLRKAGTSGRFLYEKVYCARGKMENRIKEWQATCSPTGPRQRPCAPTSSGPGSPRSPMFSCAPSDASASRTPSPPAHATCGSIRLEGLGKAGARAISWDYAKVLASPMNACFKRIRTCFKRIRTDPLVEVYAGSPHPFPPFAQRPLPALAPLPVGAPSS
jgi:Transposase DDE domain group 1